MASEFLLLISWYIILFSFGIIGLGVIYKAFKAFPDRGYGIAKFLGVFMVGICVWFFSSIKLIPFTQISVFVFALIGLTISIVLLRKAEFKVNKYMVIQEVTFLILLLVWGYIRSTNSQAEGTEKMMNIAFMNSINRTSFFPPADPWLTGPTINYYYIGHFLFVMIGKVMGLPVSYVYNYALITIIAHVFISLNSIFFRIFEGKNTRMIIIITFISSFWICFGGNMDLGYKWMKAYILGTDGFIHFLFTPTPKDLITKVAEFFAPGRMTYWFPESTRLIPYTINEFPAYSIVLGDVHGHYLGMPFLIIAIALLICSYNIPINSKQKIYFNLLSSVLIMGLYGINSWDTITANFLFFLLHFVQAAKLKEGIKVKLLSFVKAEAALIIPGILIMIPYLLSFHPPVGGIGFVPLTTDRPLLPWFLIWALFLFITFFYFIFLNAGIVKKIKTYELALLFFFASICLIIGVEFIFIKDIFFFSNGSYFRTNTVFKFYYQAWIIWGIACGYFLYSIFSSFTIKKNLKIERTALILLGVIPIMMMILSSYSYIFKSIESFYPVFKKTTTQFTLDGNNYITTRDYNDYKAIHWINSNIEGQPVIVEAVGNAYTYYARISSNTGLPTVIGWPTHEWQWRGSGDEAFRRQNEISSLYQTTDKDEFQRILREYKVSYIYVGNLEHDAYPALNEKFMEAYGEIVYSYGTSKIYKF